MNIFKIAQTSKVPDGKAIVRLTISEKGTVKREIIRGGKSSCTEDAGALLEEILNMEIPGFDGPFASVEDGGKTDEYYEQQASKGKPLSKPHKSEIREDEGTSPIFGPQQDTRQLDSGYGV
jgi:hypothetical protein